MQKVQIHKNKRWNIHQLKIVFHNEFKKSPVILNQLLLICLLSKSVKIKKSKSIA